MAGLINSQMALKTARAGICRAGISRANVTRLSTETEPKTIAPGYLLVHRPRREDGAPRDSVVTGTYTTVQVG